MSKAPPGTNVGLNIWSSNDNLLSRKVDAEYKIIWSPSVRDTSAKVPSWLVTVKSPNVLNLRSWAEITSTMRKVSGIRTDWFEFASNSTGDDGMHYNTESIISVRQHKLIMTTFDSISLVLQVPLSDVTYVNTVRELEHVVRDEAWACGIWEAAPKMRFRDVITEM